MSTNPNFRVLIAGGGVAGLTLANALEKAGIDYVLLERRDTFAAQVGASIGILPNGCRILDQLGLLDQLFKITERVLWMSDRDAQGRLICPPSDICQLGLARTGYDVSWGDRQSLLQSLFQNINDKSKLFLRKNVSSINHDPCSVTVECDDGTSFKGAILVGADGVRSKTRSELWKLVEPTQPELMRHDKTCMFAEYRCLFGIATSVQALAAGDADAGYHPGRCILMIAVRDGRVYYFLIERLEARYQFGNIPHYNQAEAEEFAIRHADMCIRTDLKFSDLWKTTISFRLVALEEAKFKIWAYGRIVCLGDSIHKMTPDLGAGGNAAIESAAALANQIKSIVDKSGEHCPSKVEIERCLASYQAGRELRAASVTDASGRLTRLHALQGKPERFFCRFLLPRLSDFLQDMLSDMAIGATMLEYLPPPKRSLCGTMPFNPKQGEGMRESKIKRILIALPLIILSYLAFVVLDAQKAFPWFLQACGTGRMIVDTHPITIRHVFYHIDWLDKWWTPINVFFLPTVSGYDAVSRKQTMSFLTDFGIIIAIWAIESVRRANALTLAQLPILFTFIGQRLGIGLLSPLYYFFHYVSSPIENFKATDMRLTRMNYTLGILPSIISTYYIPSYAMMLWTNLSGRQAWLFVWQMFPIWFAIMTFTLSHVFPDTMMHDRIHSPKRDIPIIIFTVSTLISLSAYFWIWTWFPNYGDIATVFVPGALPAITSELTGFAREFLKFDEIFLFTATFIWLGSLFWDMKHAGMIDTPWIRIVTSAAGIAVTVGPGAAAGMGWLWREIIITNKRHKAAITEATTTRWSSVKVSHKENVGQ